MTEVFDVISIGAVLIDMIAMVDEFPKKDGETFVHDFKMMPGGAAANIAVICSRLGLKTAFSGKIGNDQFGAILRDDLVQEEVSVDETLVVSDKFNTGSCYICVDKQGERMIMAFSGAADNLTIDDLDKTIFSKAKWVNLADMRNVSAIEALLESDLTINFSMSPGALIAKNPSRAYRLAEQTQLLVASKDEITQIFRCTDDEIDTVITNFVKEKKNRLVAVTKGKDGATIFSREGNYHQPIFQVEVKDTTGAGDAFAAGMLYGLNRDRSIKEAAKIAAGCSAICIQEIGARSGPKTKRDLMKFLRKY